MSKNINIYIVAVIAAVLMVGCSGENKAKNAGPGTADYLTGAEDLRAYKRAKTKIEEVNKIVEERNNDMQ